jgi:hypothetical protein
MLADAGAGHVSPDTVRPPEMLADAGIGHANSDRQEQPQV